MLKEKPLLMFWLRLLLLWNHVGITTWAEVGRRMSHSKDITENSGDFIALKTGYICGAPFLITFSSFSSIVRLNAIPVLLMWGMRRNLGHRFNYELGAKGGLLALPDNGLSVVGAYDVHLRIGYRFLGDTR